MEYLKKLVFFIMLLAAFPVASDVNVGDVPYEKLGKTIDGVKVELSHYQGKVVIITFWATWCGPCMKEIPVLSGIQKRVGKEKLQVVAISYREEKKLYKQIAEAFRDNQMVLSYDYKGKTAKKFGVRAIPHMIIVGKDGVVKSKNIGYSEEKLPYLVEEINKAINES